MISVVLAIYNEEAIIVSCLKSVSDWVDEIVIVDGSSTDETVSLIKKNFPAKLIKIISTTNKPNFHINKQMAIDAAKGDLILQLDADEHVDEELKKFILSVHRNQDHSQAAWWLNRRNLFLKTWLRKGGQYPDAVIRLFWRGQAALPMKDVHEQMKVKGSVGVAKGHLLHYSYPSFNLYLHKFNTYTSFKALQLQESKLKINFFTFLHHVFWKPFATFFSIYCRHLGLVDGWAGFVFAIGSGLHHSVAYLKYYELETPVPPAPKS